MRSLKSSAYLDHKHMFGMHFSDLQINGVSNNEIIADGSAIAEDGDAITEDGHTIAEDGNVITEDGNGYVEAEA